MIEEPPLSTITSFGTWLMGAFAIGLITLAWKTAQSGQLRRTVSVMWDAGSFWPRSAHPLAPPSYAERAVPELAERVTTLTEQPGSTVVLSGHSQGSVLVAAAILQLPEQAAARTSAVTHGSPLRRLYARFFPAYLGRPALRAVYERTRGRWRNLYRDTDPVGSWVLEPPGADAPAVDRRLPDPPALDEAIKRHAEYWDDDAYESSLAELSGPAQSGPSPSAGAPRSG